MSYMRGDLLTKTRKLVKGLAKPAPAWLKAMEQSVPSRSLAPPVHFRYVLLRPFDVGAVNCVEMRDPSLVIYSSHLSSTYGWLLVGRSKTRFGIVHNIICRWLDILIYALTIHIDDSISFII